jgi:hypothetical protein
MVLVILPSFVSDSLSTYAAIANLQKEREIVYSNDSINT